MRLRNFLAATATGAVLTSSAFAGISPALDLGKSPAQFLMTDAEQAEWKNVQTDDQAKAFADLFWARRDPTPTTPANEFKDEYNRRVAFADKNFSVRKTKGSMTDRGMVLIVVGMPKAISNTGDAAVDNNFQGSNNNFDTQVGGDGRSQSGGYATTMGGTSPQTLFVYDKEAIPPFYPGVGFAVTFVDKNSSRDYKVEPNTGRGTVKELLEKARNYYNARPNLTAADLKVPSKVETVTVPAAAIKVETPAAVATSFKTAAFGDAINAYKAAAANPYKGVYSTYGEFVTAAGEYFVPVQLYLTSAAGVAADAPVTFFGQVVDGEGKTVAVYEEQGTITAAPQSNELFFDKSLVLPSGSYTGYFGLAGADGKILGITKEAMSLSSIDKSAPGSSKLILTKTLYPLAKAQHATDPFSFGGLKVVPKADRTFSSKDELDFFVELRNPGIDTATTKPHFTAKVTIENTDNAKAGKMAGAPADIDVQPVKGVDNHYWLATGYGLDTFKPGNYKISVQLTDKVTGAKYDLESPFKVVAQ